VFGRASPNGRTAAIADRLLTAMNAVMNTRIVTTALGLLSLAASVIGVNAGTAQSHDDPRHGSGYEIGLLGDMPYGDTGRAQFPAVIADINRHRLAFSAFDGDLKNGKERCDQFQYDNAARDYASFKDPLVYVPGDNEWTDCDRPSNGSYNPSERLALVRKMFAATPESLGQRKIPLQRQAPNYPENVRWALGGVTYVGVNVTGSDNNAPQFDSTGKQVDGDAAEYTARNAANLAWLDESFAQAKAARSVAVMIVQQADMWAAADPTPHFADTKRELARLAIDFPGQVVIVNGDSHVLQIDKPLKDAAGTVIQNVTRVQTFGSDQNHWVSATVDPKDPNVFTFHQHVIAANVPTYVKP
jgi:hypothetical protein